MVAEAALSLVYEGNEIRAHRQGGVVTPAYAFGDILITR